MGKNAFHVGTSKASIEVTGASTVLNRVVNLSTRALRQPLQGAMSEIKASAEKDWPRPTYKNRGGNRRRKNKGFSPPGWASTGFSQKSFGTKTYINPSQNGLSIAVALTNAAQSHPRKGRYFYMARYPYPSRKFYWRELVGKPMKRRSKKLITELAKVQIAVIEGK
tara:strand:- start:289 stop:786 length:498 start_codon:yes stop_codon:yes gene_type:complete